MFTIYLLCMASLYFLAYIVFVFVDLGDLPLMPHIPEDGFKE